MDIIKTITIAVCGVQPRSGATTQALQLVAYLQMMGNSAAYVELMQQGYIEQMRKLYKDIAIDGMCVLYDRIPMYRSIMDVEESYDYLVKDYGSMDRDTFNQVSFLEQDIHIICGGVKPNEIFVVNEVLKKSEYHPAKFVFTFVPPDQKEGILGLMTNRAKNTYFANYNPDPFSYDSTMNKSYRLILGRFMDGLPATHGKKKGLKQCLKGAVAVARGWWKVIGGCIVIRMAGLGMYTVLLYFLFTIFLR